MKYIVLFVLFLSLDPSFCEAPITWSETEKLKWEDFKAAPKDHSDAVAYTVSGIYFGYSLKTSGDRIVGFSTSVEAQFYPSKSWYVKDKTNLYILAHEQLHFDITELYARKLRQELSKLAVNQNLKEQMLSCHTAMNKAVNETQKQYDFQTQHALNKTKQKEWEMFIAKELQQLADFKSL